jgi:hypothetical protein
MTGQEFRAIYPLIFAWIQNTLTQFAPVARPVSSLGFRRLPGYYGDSILSDAKVVVVPKVPVPPLSAMGLDRFADFERMSTAGITYLDTFFVVADQAGDESLHFHELVHVIQWRVLGPERFLWLYADGLERFGYRNSPLEVMAYDSQDRFNAGGEAFDVEAEVRRWLSAMK